VGTAESAVIARTKAALAAAKARGTRLGGLRWDLSKVAAKGREVALQTRQGNAAKYRADVLPVIQEKQRLGSATLQQIADSLNADGTPAPRGGI
jgi:hypothetical protein